MEQPPTARTLCYTNVVSAANRRESINKATTPSQENKRSRNGKKSPAEVAKGIPPKQQKEVQRKQQKETLPKQG